MGERKMDDSNKLEIFQAAVAQMSLYPFGIHGPIHWHRVYDNCLNLYYMETGEQATDTYDWFFYNFAMMHDCCRVSDHADIEHPYAAAKLIPDGDPGTFNDMLKIAIQNHSTGSRSEEPLIAMCWDADRLDLPRVNIVPDPKFMSTKSGQKIAEDYKK
jgi:uncharacterized protein